MSLLGFCPNAVVQVVCFFDCLWLSEIRKCGALICEFWPRRLPGTHTRLWPDLRTPLFELVKAVRPLVDRVELYNPARGFPSLVPL